MKGTISYGLRLRASSHTNLIGFADAGYGSDQDDCRSQHGFAIYYGSNLISWASTKQRVVARSSTEAEYRALAATTAEVLWLQQLLRELDRPLKTPPLLLCDNLSATFMTHNPVLHKRSKHIHIDYHFVRERVASKELLVRHVQSVDQMPTFLLRRLAHNAFFFYGPSFMFFLDHDLARGY